MSAIASDQHIAAFPYRSRQHRAILLWQQCRVFRGQLMMPKWHDFDVLEQGIQRRDARLTLGFEIPSCFGDHIQVRAQRVSTLA